MNNYLNKEILNDIESKVAHLHTLFKSKFDLTETSLRNLKVGDNLNQRIIHLNFPWESYENILYEKKFITIDDNNFICSKLNATSTAKYIGYKYNNNYNFLCYKYDNSINNIYNYIRYKLPKNYGIISSINKDDEFYKYVKVKDDEYKLLEYNEKIWVNNEIPYLQYIDNIEEGINNVAKILYKPIGYEYKEWTTTGYYGIESNDYGLAQKPISNKDFERWNKNIDLLKNAINDINNIWNVVSSIDWNKESQFEWEDN